MKTRDTSLGSFKVGQEILVEALLNALSPVFNCKRDGIKTEVQCGFRSSCGA